MAMNLLKAVHVTFTGLSESELPSETISFVNSTNQNLPLFNKGYVTDEEIDLLAEKIEEMFFEFSEDDVSISFELENKE